MKTLKKRKKIPLHMVVIHGIFLLLTLFCVLPLLLVVSISFTSESSLIVEGYSLFPKELSLAAYEYVFGGAASVMNAYGVTIVVTVLGVAGHLLVTAMLAYPLSRSEVTYRNRIALFVYIPVLFSGGLVPFYMLLTRGLRLKNTIWVLIIVYLVSAVNVLIMKNFFKSIPNSLVESARIDGSGECKTFFRIVLPISTPVIASIGLFVAIAYWNDWMTCSLYIETPKLYTLQYLLQSLMNNIGYLQSNAAASQSIMKQIGMLPSEGARMATCVLSIGPIIMLYPFMQKYFAKGMTIGAVKG